MTTKKDDKPEKAEKIPAFSSIDVPLSLMLAALACASTEQTRYYLCGVHLHAVKNALRVVATDGHRLLVCTHSPADLDQEMPAWLADGLIVPADGLKPRLSLIKSAAGDVESLQYARVSYAAGAPHILLGDPRGTVQFKLSPVDGAFPDYQRIVEQTGGCFDPSSRGDFEPVGFHGPYLKAVGEIGKILGAETIGVYASKASEPAVVTFAQKPGAMLILMPTRIDAVMQKETAAILSPAIKGSIAALKAHVTRNREAAEALPEGSAERADLEAKAKSFQDRILDIMVRTGQRKALPAPEAPVEPAGATEMPGTIDAPAEPVTAEPVAAEPVAPSTTLPATTERAPDKRAKRAAKKARTRAKVDALRKKANGHHTHAA